MATFTDQQSSTSWAPRNDKFGNLVNPTASDWAAMSSEDQGNFTRTVQDLATRAAAVNANTGAYRDSSGTLYGTNPNDVSQFSNYQLPDNPYVKQALGDFSFLSNSSVGQYIDLNKAKSYFGTLAPAGQVDPSTTAQQLTGRDLSATSTYTPNQNPYIATATPAIPGLTYTVKPGDNLSKIAAQYGVPASSITGYSSGDPNLIQPGEVLTIKNPTTPGVLPSSGVTSVNSISPVSSLGITDPTSSTSAAASIIAGANATSQAIKDYVTQLTPPTSPTQTSADAITARLNTLLGEEAGQTTALATAEAQAGVDTFKADLTAKNNAINTLVAQRQALDVDIQGKPVTMDSIIGAKAQAHAVLDAQIGSLTAEAQAIMGNITLAEDTAQKAVTAKYGPILEEIKIKQDQLALLQPTLDKEQKTWATALDAYYKDQQNKLEVKISNEKDLNSTLLNLIQSYPDAKIGLSDTIQQANAKIVANSRIYADKVRPPVGATVSENILEKNDAPSVIADLTAKAGTDHFVSDNDYTSIKQAWVQAGHSAASFDTRFGAWKSPNKSE